MWLFNDAIYKNNNIQDALNLTSVTDMTGEGEVTLPPLLHTPQIIFSRGQEAFGFFNNKLSEYQLSNLDLKVAALI